jgi:hypothetical protein
MPTINEISEQIRNAGMGLNQMPGGVADGKRPEDFDQQALEKGTRMEMEHTSDADVAREIAMDHLAEDPAYYDKLEEMEKTQGVNMRAFVRFAARPIRMSWKNVATSVLKTLYRDLPKQMDSAKDDATRRKIGEVYAEVAQELVDRGEKV